MTYTQLYDQQGRFEGVQRTDGACVPNDSANSDWRAFLAWNAKQPAPLSLVDIVPSPLTPAEQLDAIGSRLTAALAFLASASWATATAKQQTAAQKLIDDVGAKVAGILPK